MGKKASEEYYERRRAEKEGSGYVITAPGPGCPNCGSDKISYFGAEVTIIPCYDYKKSHTSQYYRCLECQNVLKIETVYTMGFMKVGVLSDEKLAELSARLSVPAAAPH